MNVRWRKRGAEQLQFTDSKRHILLSYLTARSVRARSLVRSGPGSVNISVNLNRKHATTGSRQHNREKETGQQQAGSPVFAISGSRSKEKHGTEYGGRHPENAGTGTYGGYLPAGDQRNCRRTGKNTRMVRRRRSAPCIQDGCRCKAAKQESAERRAVCRGVRVSRQELSSGSERSAAYRQKMFSNNAGRQPGLQSDFLISVPL